MVAELIGDPRVGSVMGHHTADMASGPELMTAIIAGSQSYAMDEQCPPDILSRLGHRCRGGHRHQALIGDRAVAAAIYPPQLCRAILRGAVAQGRQEGAVLPPAVAAELAALGVMGPGLRSGVSWRRSADERA